VETAAVQSLLTQYRESAHGTSAPDPKIANKCQREMHPAYKGLRDTPEGRAGITALMTDSTLMSDAGRQPTAWDGTWLAPRALYKPCEIVGDLAHSTLK